MKSEHLVSRRRFLRLASAGAALTTLPCAAAATTGQVPLIDTHTHFYDPKRPQGVPWPDKKDSLLYKPYLPEHFRAVTQPFGAVGTVVVEASPWVEDNQWVLDLAKDNPVIVGFVGHLDPGQPEFAANLRRFGANPLFRGIRLGGNALVQGLGKATLEADRILFGSNWPVSEHTAPYSVVHKIVADYFNAKGPAAAEKFFWINSLAVYWWIARGEAAKLGR